MGRNHDPVTLHKYLYANADPINYTDPTGNFGMAEMSITMNIVGTLTTMQIDNAFSVFDQLGVNDPAIETARMINKAAGLFMLGSAGVQLTKLLSKKLIAKCAGKGDTCIRAALGKIKTPHGIAQQLDSPEAWAALSNAQSGEPLYRVGKFGRSNTSDAQFWSLKDPRKMDPKEFADAFGIPKANANFEFLMIGRLKPGQMAITRQAPGVGGNAGGSIEVVTNPNSVALEVFHTF